MIKYPSLYLEILCQRPKRAFIISTDIMEMLSKTDFKGVNALNGLLSFLHTINCYHCFWASRMCQRPKRAFIISTNMQNQQFVAY